MGMINELSAGVAILIFIVFLGVKWYKNDKIILADIVIAMMSGGMLPLAFGFIIYPFKPSFIGSIENKGLQITLTGLVLFFVYIKTILEKFKS